MVTGSRWQVAGGRWWAAGPAARSCNQIFTTNMKYREKNGGCEAINELSKSTLVTVSSCKVTPPPQTVLPTGEQMFKYLTLWGHFSF